MFSRQHPFYFVNATSKDISYLPGEIGNVLLIDDNHKAHSLIITGSEQAKNQRYEKKQNHTPPTDKHL